MNNKMEISPPKNKIIKGGGGKKANNTSIMTRKQQNRLNKKTKVKEFQA